ncbi:MAG: single-stranded DNA-binding protein, partial [Spirochaetia bacterium]|nr:single-stranded DNA-binding protein [Spirochaetia bacterium]
MLERHCLRVLSGPANGLQSSRCSRNGMPWRLVRRAIMSNNINVTVLSGRVCADAELKYTNNGTAVCNFSLAVNKYRSSQDGQGKEEVSFFNCSMFGKGAESFNQRLLKGVPVIVNGELKQDRWNDQDG